jgi:hypothetical protein
LISSHDHEALWIKAKLFINRAMDDDESRTMDERCLWAALSLELLGKAALSRVSPLLIAEPTEDGNNLLIASGLVAGEARFISARAKTIFARCHKAFKPFNLQEAIAITGARNEYLHGAGIGFTAIPESAWWPKFWAQASILISALDREIEEFVGTDREDIVKADLAQNAKNVEHRVEALIERARQRLAQYRDGTLPAKVAKEFANPLDRTAWLKYKSTEVCPACGSEGFVEGDEVIDTEVETRQIDYDDWERIVTHDVSADYFSCPACHLVLNGYELLDQAGIPLSFGAAGDPSEAYALEAEYGND